MKPRTLIRTIFVGSVPAVMLIPAPATAQAHGDNAQCPRRLRSCGLL
jgi:hypothetical protein